LQAATKSLEEGWSPEGLLPLALKKPMDRRGESRKDFFQTYFDVIHKKCTYPRLE
jgi:hypothetical protein